jgi:Na+/proline symporter
MLVVGAALYVFYVQSPPSPAEAAMFKQDPDSVFPVWITTQLPPGVTGLILAGAFAAAISSLDSALAALAQTSLALVYGKRGLESADQATVLWQSRAAVVFWGVALVACAIGLQLIRGNLNLISLAFGMVTYTYGPLLGAFLLALSPVRKDIRGIWIGTILSILLTLWARPDLYNLLASFGVLTIDQASAMRPSFTFAWLFPITCLLTLGCGYLFGRNRPILIASANT